jgi:TonB family protein
VVTTPDRESVSFALPATAMAPDGAPEPHFAAIPGVIASGGPLRLDPARANSAEPARPAQSARRTILPFALIGSIALHLLPLVTLVEWHVAPVEPAAPIPVQLVVVPPPPPPPPPAEKRPPPREKQRPPPGRLASEDMGSPSGERHGTGADKAPAAAPKPAPAPPTPPTDLVSDLPPPKPGAVPLPAPTDQSEQQAMLPPPRPTPPAPPRRLEPPVPRIKRLPGSWPLAPAHLGAPGPAATRDEYLAYCNALIKRHFDMLPPSFIAGRRGMTVLSLRVLDDGRIARIAIVRSSGYDDIDERVEKMVAAVGRFPPLPQWFQGEQMSMLYDLPIPGGLSGP